MRGTYSLLDGHHTRLIKLQDQYKDEYEALTEEQREDLIEEFTVQQDERAKIKRPTPKARIADVANIVRNMQLLVRGFVRSYGFG
jgi:DNA-directed RNA polymerase subunit H (RpoH/RPB5)